MIEDDNFGLNLKLLTLIKKKFFDKNRRVKDEYKKYLYNREQVKN